MNISSDLADSFHCRREACSTFLRKVFAMRSRFFLLAALTVWMAGCAETQPVEPPPVHVRKPAPPKPKATVRWITPEQAWQEVQHDPDLFILCVADKEEYDRGHIAGSVIIPVMGLERGLEKNDWWPDINFGRVPRKDQKILCYCWWKSCDCPSVPTYSQLARKILLRKGYRDIDIIVGGMRAITLRLSTRGSRNHSGLSAYSIAFSKSSAAPADRAAPSHLAQPAPG